MPIVADEAVIRVRGQVDPSLQASAAAAGSAYQRLAQDVRQASADFNAGIISVEDYKVALSTARAEAVTLRSAGVVPAGRDIGALNTVLRSTGPASTVARQGLGTIRSSLAAMTATAIGARGTIGTLGGAILQFAAGNTIAVAAIAGIAAIAFAWRKFTENAREAREELVKVRDEMAKKFPDLFVGPVGVAGARANQLRQEQARLLEAITQTKQGDLVVGPGGLTSQRVDVRRLNQLNEELQETTIALAVAERELNDAREKGIETATKARQEWIAEHMPAAFNIQGIRAPLRGGLRLIEPRHVQQNAIGAGFQGEDMSLANKIVGDLRQREFELLQTRQQLATLLDQGKITQDEYAKALQSVDGATKQAAKSTAQFAVAAINSASAMIAMAAGGGGSLGGFLGLAGGLLSFIPGGQIPGAIVGGLGAIVSATERRGDDAPIPVRIADVSDRAAGKLAKTGPDRVQLYVVDARGNIREIRDLLNRAQQRDAIPRLAGAA